MKDNLSIIQNSKFNMQINVNKPNSL